MAGWAIFASPGSYPLPTPITKVAWVAEDRGQHVPLGVTNSILYTADHTTKQTNFFDFVFSTKISHLIGSAKNISASSEVIVPHTIITFPFSLVCRKFTASEPTILVAFPLFSFHFPLLFSLTKFRNFRNPKKTNKQERRRRRIESRGLSSRI